MSAMPRNKKVAALLTGASLLTLVGVSRASAVKITGANNTGYHHGQHYERSCRAHSRNHGDVINQWPRLPPNQAGVTISAGAVIHRRLCQHVKRASVDGRHGHCCGRWDPRFGRWRSPIENNGQIVGYATATGAASAARWRCGCRADELCCGHGVRHGQQRRLNHGHALRMLPVSRSPAPPALFRRSRPRQRESVDNDGTILAMLLLRPPSTTAIAIG